jgi:hypothetical protein
MLTSALMLLQMPRYRFIAIFFAVYLMEVGSALAGVVHSMHLQHALHHHWDVHIFNQPGSTCHSNGSHHLRRGHCHCLLPHIPSRPADSLCRPSHVACVLCSISNAS